MNIDLTESEYRTLLEGMSRAITTPLVPDTKRRYLKVRDNLRVRWERAADEERKEAVK